MPTFVQAFSPHAQPLCSAEDCRQIRQLADLLERASDAGAWTFSIPTSKLSLTARLSALLELAPDAPSPFANPCDFFSPAGREPVIAALAACRTVGQPFDLQAEATTAKGSRLWVRVLGEAAHDAHGNISGLQGILRNVGAERQAEHDAQRLTMRLSTTLDSIREAFVTLDRDGRLTYVNRESIQLLGQNEAELLGQRITDRLDKVNSRLHREIQVALAGGSSVEFEAYYAALGKWLEVRGYPFEEGIALYFRDITGRKAAEDEIERLAFYDVLTQLPNRQLLMRCLENALAKSSKRDTHPENLALMFVDLDHFKVLNDTLGHAKGDLLLQQVAVRLLECVRHGDTVARLGGDEFVILLDNQADSTEAANKRTQSVDQKVLAALSEPYDLAGYQHHATCSIGITSFSGQSDSIGDLLKKADLAMYEAKAAGRNAICFFNPRMQAAATANAELNIELRQGLRNGDFTLHYQPQVASDGRMSGVEALVRWQHPLRGLVYPKDFISQAEESGLIVPLGKWVLESACRQLASWSGQPDTERLNIAVNVSARQFRYPEFVDQVMAAIGQVDVNPKRLKLELTESLLAAHIDVTITKMDILKDAGVKLSLDDFGMGYSALSYLKRLPLDQLKIDRAFVKDVLTDPNDAAIARTIIGLAQSLGLDILAEGVETQAQHELLVRFGCESYQGHLFCKPLPIEELEIFMQQLPETALSPQKDISAL